MTPDTHLCLVSAQPVPNLTPLLDQRTAPRRVILLVSPTMEQRADWLEAVIRPRGIHVERFPVEHPYDIEHLQSRIMTLLESRPEKQERIALNATGGTKPMSIAAYEVFRAWNLPIFYIHPERDRLIWMHPAEWPAVDLADRIRLEPFLLAHGAEVSGEPARSVPQGNYLELAADLVLDIRRYRSAIGTLNWLATTAENNELRSDPLPAGHAELVALVDLFAANGLLRREAGRLHFPSEEARFFVNGGWLEYHVFDAVRRLRATREIQDVAFGVEVMRSHNGKRVFNELDVLFLHDNRLHIIECKTRKFRGEGEDTAAAEALYKLDTLKDLMGGLQARAMLVSYQDLPGYHRIRAADLGIDVCAGEQLRNLREHISRFTG